MVAQAESSQRPYVIGLALWAATTLHAAKGEWEKAHSLVERAIVQSRAGNAMLLIPSLVPLSALIYSHLGEPDLALARVREAETLVDGLAANGIVSNRAINYQALGRACLLMGWVDEAQRLGHRAAESSPDFHGFAAHCAHLLGDVATHPARFDAERAEARYRESLSIAEPRDMRPLIAHCHAGLARFYRRTDKPQQAAEHFAVAKTMYREMGMAYWLEKAEAEMEA